MAFGGAEAGGGHDHGFVTGDVPHGDEGQDGGADGENRRKGEDCTLPEFFNVVPLEEIYSDYYLISQQYEAVQVA